MHFVCFSKCVSWFQVWKGGTRRFHNILLLYSFLSCCANECQFGILFTTQLDISAGVLLKCNTRYVQIRNFAQTIAHTHSVKSQDPLVYYFHGSNYPHLGHISGFLKNNFSENCITKTRFLRLSCGGDLTLTKLKYNKWLGNYYFRENRIDLDF